MSSGSGSQQSSKPVVQNIHPTPMFDDNSVAISIVVDSDVKIADAKLRLRTSETLPNVGSKKPISRLRILFRLILG